MRPYTSLKKRNFRPFARDWTTGSDDVQGLRRNPGVFPWGTYEKRSFQVSGAMNTYFKRHAMRHPQMPPGQFVQGQPPYLYRGIPLAVWRGMRKGMYRDKGFIATTRDVKIAASFGEVVFRIHVFSGVPRGTPWLWFTDADDRVRQHRNYFRSQFPKENEVLLPPGQLRAVGPPRKVVHGRTITLVDAVYTPAKAYAFQPRRKGAPANWNAYKLPNLF